ncbi:helix-turn-helix domain-containing protein [Chryseobacterium potabilaquae]|uniref:HTH cro/C1-type domain-containing protein n=1 Tax=Chryseobacterium potabilaquae TaxID=2675057 RepID=A0A6N4X810_9FLAO|nr:helix-turn-helix transcriptional regulator [Chryseobacterium potabilaquae]CAA7195418.1 hypothetical protein CHRY9293_01617 [Chryseobacterium potabilaquae]
MNKLDIKNFRTRYNLSQEDLAQITGSSVRTVKSWEYGERNISKVAQKIIENYTQNVENIPLNPTKEAVLKKLKEVKKNNGHKEKDRILDASGLVRQRVITIPIPGFAGLQQHFFSEDYIEQNFMEEEVLVRVEEKITDPYYRIQVKENNYSMSPTLLPLEWVWCEPISEIFWNDPKTFKKQKIYCLWHPTKGILYKRISKYKQGIITLSSDNENKDDYPDQDFFIGEFKRIFLIRKKEVEL